MSTAKKIVFGALGVLGVGIVAILGLAATKPDAIHVERSRVMPGTPAAAFAHANDLRALTTWIPWTELDPHQTMTYSEPAAGKGAWYEWSGNDDVGKGRMEVIDSQPDAKVVHALSFIEPFESQATSTVSIEDVGNGKVEVTWTFDQEATFGTKVMLVFMDMDAMIGADFEKGLARLEPLLARSK